MILCGVDEPTDDFISEFANIAYEFVERITPEIDKAYEQGQFERIDSTEEESRG